jgi:type IV secretion system protein VirD4
MYLLLRFILIQTILIAASVLAVVVQFNPAILLTVFGVGFWKIAGSSQRRSTAHGTARWAEPRDVPHMLGGNGLMLGYLSGRISTAWKLRSLFNVRVPSREACRRFFAFKPIVRLNDAVHTAIFAPTGVGKGVSFVIPHLLTCVDSMVVVDFKGELAKLTARARRAMGHRVVLLDPYQVVTREPDAFNPLEFIDPESPTALDDCRDLAEALVIRTGLEKEPHWADAAEAFIAAMTALVATMAKGDEKSLQTVRELLTNPDKMQAAIAAMCASDQMGGLLARLGHQLTQFKDRELSSTLTTANRFLRFLDTPAIAESTKRSSFDPADLLKGKMTVYLILPPDRARAQSPLLRLWVGSMLRAVVRGGLQETTKVRVVLDEAASLGAMPAIDDAVDKLRGYGVRLYFYWQSLGQLKKCFPDGQDQTFLSNMTQIFFGVQDQQTAEYVSARLGEATISTESGGTSDSTTHQRGVGNESYSTSTSRNRNWQYMGRRLLKPEEVTTLPERVAITFTPGAPPIMTRLIRYYERDFKALGDKGLFRLGFDVIFLFIMTVAFVWMVLKHLLSQPAY